MIKGTRTTVCYKGGNPKKIIYGRMIVYKKNREPPNTEYLQFGF